MHITLYNYDPEVMSELLSWPFAIFNPYLLFQDHPNYKSCFPKLRHLNDMDLINTEELRSHTDLFLTNLRVLIYSLDNPNECFYELERAAIAHEKTNIKRYHVEAMFPILIETLCQSGIVDEKTYVTWKKLFDAMNLYQDMIRNGVIQSRSEKP
ncbi:unnamed protein product [Soboliphyme baturini]|uniref:GLOBIN domain-containing protein n=1 Tax=Soboliphyme baturini TaxID=241478 RepID=A0A183IT31_9BILA|nr:unnamed protein product [Soboliphyme baturini]